MTLINSRRYPSDRFRQLEDSFKSLEPQLEESPVKTAISVLHGMLHEALNEQNAAYLPYTSGEDGLASVAHLYKTAPKMEGEAENAPLVPGMPAPNFSLPDATGKMVNLADYKGRRVMLVFYPLDWSPGCSQQLDLYQSEIALFREHGLEVIGISVDSIYSHGAWAATRGITFPLLSDFNPKGETAKKYQVYREHDGFSERAIYLIDPDGMISYSYVSPYLEHVPDIYELIKHLEEEQVLVS